MNRLEIENKLWNQNYKRIMGLDEVGRGCLSGPVVAGGVILKPGTKLDGVKDSKQLSLTKREAFESLIKERALFWTVQWCSPGVIDEINILQASLKAMHKCTETEGAKADYLLVDGNRYRPTVRPYSCIVGGDDRSLSIAAASILAKVQRDRWMKKLHEQYPYYGWDTNVGYPTKKHFEGLKKHGITEYHRRSFTLRTTKKFSL